MVDSGETLPSYWVEQLPFLGNLVQVEQSKVSKILVSQRSLDLHGEVVIHFEHGHGDVILVIAAAKAKADETPSQNSDFAHVPASPLDEVRVPDSACEENSGASRQVLVIIHPVHFVIVALKCRVELTVLNLPFVIVSKHFQEEVFVHRVVDGLATHELSAKHVFADWSFLKVPREKGVHIK